jgi:hypothetical protein
MGSRLSADGFGAGAVPMAPIAKSYMVLLTAVSEGQTAIVRLLRRSQAWMKSMVVQTQGRCSRL